MNAHALVLAAGAGSRFGGSKLTSDFRGRPLIHWALDAASKTKVETITVVVGAPDDPLIDAISAFAEPRVTIVRCADSWRGQSASLKCGLRSLPADASAAIIFLGDMPLVSRSLAQQLLDAVLAGSAAALPSCRGLPAHPVAFARDLFEQICAIEGDRGARALLERVPGRLHVQTTDPGSTFDVDNGDDVLTASSEGNACGGRWTS